MRDRLWYKAYTRDSLSYLDNLLVYEFAGTTHSRHQIRLSVVTDGAMARGKVGSGDTSFE